MTKKDGWPPTSTQTRPLLDLGLVLRTEQLAYAPLTTWQGGIKGWRQLIKPPTAREPLSPNIGRHAARVEAPTGDLLFVRTEGEFNTDELPSAGSVTLDAIRSARDAGYRVVAPDITAWQLPIWLAADVLDAAAVIDRTTSFQGVEEKASSGRPRDRRRYPRAIGLGRWREAIYFHALNAGLRLSAVAGSGSGASRSDSGDSPLGTNRVYAYCRDGFGATSWWDAVAAGETVVTNGPTAPAACFQPATGARFSTRRQWQFPGADGAELEFPAEG